jgi:hypothetical protein
MAIDPNVLLRGIVPDAVGAASRGFDLGNAIRNAPLLRKQREQQIEAGTQQAQTENLKQQQNEAVAAFQLFGDTPITAENFDQAVNLASAQGLTFDDNERLPTLENIQGFNQAIQAGGRIAVASGRGKSAVKGVEGDFTFEDTKGNIFSQQTFLDPNTQKVTARLTDITGGGAQPQGQLTPISTTGESSQEKRRLDAENKALVQQNITDIKNSALAEGEEEKLLGRERGIISTGIRDGANTARRTRSNLLRVRRALEAVGTGRLAAGRNLLGNVLPAVRDANAEKFQSLATQFALDELSRQSGTKTDFDFQKAAETQARLGNTKEANREIIDIAFDRIDEIEDEERQFRAFTKKGGNAEDFQFSPVPVEFVALMRANKDNEQMKKDFKSKYGFLPTGI